MQETEIDRVQVDLDKFATDTTSIICCSCYSKLNTMVDHKHTFVSSFKKAYDHMIGGAQGEQLRVHDQLFEGSRKRPASSQLRPPQAKKRLFTQTDGSPTVAVCYYYVEGYMYLF